MCICWCIKIKYNPFLDVQQHIQLQHKKFIAIEMDYYDLDYAEHEVHDIPDYEMYMPTVVEIWTACVSPSLEQIFKYSLPFIFWITVFRITSQNCK